MDPRGMLMREREALYSYVLIRKPEEAEQEEDSERDKVTSEEVTYIEDGSNPEGYSNKEYESEPDDNSEEEFNPGIISSPAGIEEAVLNPATFSNTDEDPDLQEDLSLYRQPSR